MWYVIDDTTLETVEGGFATKDDADLEAYAWNLTEGYSAKYRVVQR